jgi:hypothetical protein
MLGEFPEEKIFEWCISIQSLSENHLSTIPKHWSAILRALTMEPRSRGIADFGLKSNWYRNEFNSFQFNFGRNDFMSAKMLGKRKCFLVAYVVLQLSLSSSLCHAKQLGFFVNRCLFRAIRLLFDYSPADLRCQN